MIANLRKKFQLGFFLVGFICVSTIGFLGFYFGKRGIIKEVENKLICVQSLKRAQISEYFSNLRSQALFLSKGTFFNLLAAFKEAFFKVKEELKISDAEVEKYKLELKKYYEENVLKELNLISDQPKRFEDFAPQDPNAIILQYLYLVKNPNPVGKKYELDDAGDGSTYSKLHAIYQPIFRFFIKTFKNANVYLFDAESGYCLYSTTKHADFANDAFHGALSESNLGALIHQLIPMASEDETRMVDFAFYDFSNAQPKSFIGSPTFNLGQKIGFFVIEISIDSLNNIVNDEKNWEEVGLGKTGENYLVGPDFKMRSAPRRFHENFEQYLDDITKAGQNIKIVNRIRLFDTTVLLQEINTRAVQAAVNGQIGLILAPNKEGVYSYTAYAPLGIPDVNWAIITQMSSSEVLQPVHRLAKTIILISLLLFLIIFILSFRYINYVLRPLNYLNNKLKALVESKRLPLDTMFDLTGGKLGEMAASLNTLFDKLKRAVSNTSKVSENFQESLSNLNKIGSDLKEGQTVYEILDDSGKYIAQIDSESSNLKEQKIKLASIAQNIFSYLENYKIALKSMDELAEVGLKDSQDRLKYYVKNLSEIYEQLQSELSTIKSVENSISEINKSSDEQFYKIKNILSVLMEHQNQIKFKSDEINSVKEQINKLKEDIDGIINLFLVEES